VLSSGLAAAVLAGGCTAARNNLGTSDSGCYVALPAAQAALHGAGTFHGVRLVSVKSLHQFERLHAAAVSEPSARVKEVCLVAFTGHFRAATVSQPHGQPSGRFAVVVVEYPDNRVLGTVIFAHIPVRVAHTHFAG
jgi:hypothetical protein